MEKIQKEINRRKRVLERDEATGNVAKPAVILASPDELLVTAAAAEGKGRARPSGGQRRDHRDGIVGDQKPVGACEHAEIGVVARFSARSVSMA